MIMYLYSLDKCHPMNHSYVNDAQESEERLLCLFNPLLAMPCIVANSLNYSQRKLENDLAFLFFLRERGI